MHFCFLSLGTYMSSLSGIPEHPTRQLGTELFSPIGKGGNKHSSDLTMLTWQV